MLPEDKIFELSLLKKNKCIVSVAEPEKPRVPFRLHAELATRRAGERRASFWGGGAAAARFPPWVPE